MSSILQFDPPGRDYTTGTKEVLEFDMTAALGSIDGASSVASPVVEMTDLRTGDVIDLGADPIANETSVTILVDGSKLTIGSVYRLSVRFTAAPTSNIVELYTFIRCVF